MSSDLTGGMKDTLKTRAEISARAAYTRMQIDGVLPSLHLWCPYVPSPKQLSLLMSDYPEVLYGGAAGGGKTGLLIMAALKYVHNPRYRALILRCSYPALKEPDGILDQMREWLAGTGAKWNHTDSEWRFPSGAIIRLGHMQDDRALTRYVGGGYHFIGFDQLEQFQFNQYKFLFSRVRKRVSTADIPLRVFSTANPSDDADWIWNHFIDPKKVKLEDDFIHKIRHRNDRGDEWDSVFVPASLKENPGMDVESYLQSLAHLDETDRMRLLEGDWTVKPKGDIYHMWNPPVHVITRKEICRFLGLKNIRHFLAECSISNGLDTGFSEKHLTCLSWLAVPPKGHPLADYIFVFAERTLKMPDEDTIAATVKNVEAQFLLPGQFVHRRMSHESLSERRTLEKLGFNYSGQTPNAAEGISFIRYYLTATNVDKPNIFRPKVKGTARMMFIVGNGQGELKEMISPKDKSMVYYVQPAIDEEGLKMHRAQIPSYRWNGKKPKDVFDDMNHALRNGILTLPKPKGLTEERKKDSKLPAELQMSHIENVEDSRERQILTLRRAGELAIMAKMQQRARDKQGSPVWARTFLAKG